MRFLIIFAALLCLTFPAQAKPVGPDSITEQPSLDVDLLYELAEKGDVASQALLADYYEELDNFEEAFYWLTQAANQNDARSARRLGSYYSFGVATEENKKAAFEWFKKAAELGDVGAMNSVAYLYETGVGTERDPKKAMEFYQKAADHGHGYAKVNLAVSYLEGYIVEPDYEKARDLLLSAAEDEVDLAYYNLGHLYAEGIAVEESSETAFEWFKKAAEAGNFRGQNAVGYCYSFGIGTEKNIYEALKWMERAAKQGDRIAMHNAAHIYHNDLPWIKKDFVRAYAWYKAAEHLGYKDSTTNISFIKRSMTNDQIRRGEQLGKEYIEKYPPTPEVEDSMYHQDYQDMMDGQH